MRINFLYRAGGGFSWSFGIGFANALKKLGHEVNSYEERYLKTMGSMRNADYSGLLNFLKTPTDCLMVVGGDKYYPLFTDSEIFDYVKNLTIPKVIFLFEDMFSLRRVELRYRKSLPLWSHIFLFEELNESPIRELTSAKIFWIPSFVDTEKFKPLDIPEINDCAFFGHLYKYSPRLETFYYIGQRIKLTYRKYSEIDEYVKAINQTKIVLALPSYFKSGSSYEAMACGKLIICPAVGENRLKAQSLFEDKKHLAYYRTKEEALDLIKYYLEHEEERKKIGESARQEIVSKHNTDVRAKEIMDKLRES